MIVEDELDLMIHYILLLVGKLSYSSARKKRMGFGNKIILEVGNLKSL